MKGISWQRDLFLENKTGYVSKMNIFFFRNNTIYFFNLKIF